KALGPPLAPGRLAADFALTCGSLALAGVFGSCASREDIRRVTARDMRTRRTGQPFMIALQLSGSCQEGRPAVERNRILRPGREAFHQVVCAEIEASVFVDLSGFSVLRRFPAKPEDR